MRAVSNFSVAPVLFALLALPAVTASAQEQDTSNPNIVVTGQEAELDMSALPKGPDIKGIVTARKGDRVRITSADGTMVDITLAEITKIKGAGKTPSKADILNGLPVTVKTLQSDRGLIASQISFKGRDFKTANMINSFNRAIC
jgi:hypothetical protein